MEIYYKELLNYDEIVIKGWKEKSEGYPGAEREYHKRANLGRGSKLLKKVGL